MKKVLLLVGVALAVVLALGVSYPTANTGPQGDKGAQGDRGAQGVAGRDGKDGARGPQGAPGKNGDNLGALVGPDLFVPYLNVNGINRTFTRLSFTQGTSTVCSILSPAATSTLVSAKVQMTVATDTDLFFGWGRGTGSRDFATTTLYDRSATTSVGVSFANNATGADDFLHSVYATTGVDSIDTANKFDPQNRSVRTNPIFSPNDRFNVRVAAKNVDIISPETDAITFNLTGSCEAIFEQF